ncbi:hypothetical protein BS17DRAFT_770031 [Gyrodon lividus]|nr:hypothetical protein BS17DRAFT_770031 [Gyrodon lividus]
MDKILEHGVHQGNDLEPMETLSTLLVSNGAYAWELRKPPSIQSAAEALWTCNFKGQYVDGHEQDDIVWYHQNVFLKQWAEMEELMHTWDLDESTNNTNFPVDGTSSPQKKHCVWFHNESTLCASLMVALADHKWLHFPDGKEPARVLFKAGKVQDGYFTNDVIVAQAWKAIKLVKEHFPDEDHVLVFDNVTTHLKHPDTALSACKMPKHPSKGTNWGIEVTVKDAAGKIMYRTDGKPSKVKVQMGDSTFKDGSPQSLYFPNGHPCAGIFKGMVIILKECRYCDMLHVHAECPGFICDPTVEHSCCWHMLYNFVNIKSTLKLAYASEGVCVLFLPKFHCELNFIEQCWGHAKQMYCQYPTSSKEEDLERNVVDALQSVTLDHMQK